MQTKRIDRQSSIKRVRPEDHRLLCSALRLLATSVKPSTDRAWFRNPALRVIDCVLSLNRNYDRFVVPRLDNFERSYVGITSVGELLRLIDGFSTPHHFMVETLNYRHEARAVILRSVLERLFVIAGDGPESMGRISAWAEATSPREAKSFGVPGFGLAGFQYLRMLFGGNTIKPDLHICRYVGQCVGHRVGPLAALYLLEKAAPEADVVLRDLDTTIWEFSARSSSSASGAATPQEPCGEPEVSCRRPRSGAG